MRFGRSCRRNSGSTLRPVLRELEGRVLNEDPTLLQPPVASRRSVVRQVAAESTRLVGRADELGLLSDRLKIDRLITLTGPGGVGKTRIAMRLAGDLWNEFDGEVFVAELAPVSDPGRPSAPLPPRLMCNNASIFPLRTPLSITYERDAHYWSSTTVSICEGLLRRSPSDFSTGVLT